MDRVAEKAASVRLTLPELARYNADYQSIRSSGLVTNDPGVGPYFCL